MSLFRSSDKKYILRFKVIIIFSPGASLQMGKESSRIFRTAFLLFAGYVDAATTFAQNCGGGGAAPDQTWGRDKNEDDILWARRCFRKAREMVTTPVIRWGMRR